MKKHGATASHGGTTAAPAAWAARVLRRWIVRRLAGPNAPAAGAPFRTVIVKLDRLGDFVLALGAIRQVLARDGAERCLLLVSPVAAPLAAREFPRTPRLVLPASLGHARAWGASRRFRATVSRVVAERAVCLRHQRWDYDELVLSWLRAPSCIRVDDTATRTWQPARRLYDHPAPGAFRAAASGRVEPGAWCRELELHRQVTERALGAPVAAADVLPTLTAPAGPPRIVVSPLGSESIKDFPAPLLAVALRHLTDRAPGRVTLIGTPAQRGRLKTLARQIGGPGAPEVCTQLSLDAYLSMVGSAPLVLSTDTATAHLAVALDRAAVIVLGGGHYGQFGPWRRSERQVWLNEPMPCNGCHWDCHLPEPFCLTRIAPDRLLAAIDAALATP